MTEQEQLLKDWHFVWGKRKKISPKYFKDQEFVKKLARVYAKRRKQIEEETRRNLEKQKRESIPFNGGGGGSRIMENYPGIAGRRVIRKHID